MAPGSMIDDMSGPSSAECHQSSIGLDTMNDHPHFPSTFGRAAFVHSPLLAPLPASPFDLETSLAIFATAKFEQDRDLTDFAACKQRGGCRGGQPHPSQAVRVFATHVESASPNQRRGSIHLCSGLTEGQTVRYPRRFPTFGSTKALSPSRSDSPSLGH